MNGGSPDPLDSFPRLRLRESDGASRRSSSSCDGDSEFERYCSANSVMETPSTSMSMRSAITVFHDFSDFDFTRGGAAASDDVNSGSENFSSAAETKFRTQRNLRYGSCGLEMYGDGGDELSMTELDSSEFIGFNRREEGEGNESDGEGGEREVEGEEGEEFSEGEESMYNYGSEGENRNEFYLRQGENANEFYASNSGVCYHEEIEVRNDDHPLFMNSSVAFGSHDLDDFLLQNGPISGMSDLFRKPQEKDDQVEEGAVSSGGKEGRIDEKDEEVEETKDGGDSEDVKDVKDVRDRDRDKDNDILAEYSCSQGSHNSEVCQEGLDMVPEEVPQNRSLDVTDGVSKEKGGDEAIATRNAQCVNPEVDNSMSEFDYFGDRGVDHNSSDPRIHVGSVNAKSFENLEPIVLPSSSGMGETLESSSTSTSLLEKGPVMSKKEDFELNEFYDEVVQEMEEILLDSVDSPAARLSMGNRFFEPQLSMPLRDGGMTASTSSTDDAYLLVQRPRRINRIEVVGARQKKGDVSLSERLVGVKEYTVYKIKVWSGKDQWEVERRYRDFLTLYRCLKTLFNEQGWILPLPWLSVEKESKIFRSASPDIIVKRSDLIQECLQSILCTRFFSSPPRPLIWFLSPQDAHPISPVSNAPAPQSSFTRGENIRNFSTLGKTISLIVEMPSNKSIRQLLEAQHYTCAGCHKHFDDGKTLIWDFVQTLGWGKPRLCEYTGQLFCSSCHTNDTAVLPARVLHHWDFTRYPVSQMAKSYLDSIHEQPMLCVTAVNPFLLSRVPALLHVMNVRKKIGIMLPYVRCPFRRSINRGLGNRRYLLESNDFFALKDLLDLSKGVFAALPVMVETLSRKILEHITDQCLICCDVGDPCSARQDCSDPSSLIFPFQGA
ncbi:uncharacterized protein LOC130734499 isoform X2 [Lotus japonicus]|uniref:uncharacterized protein LOC130734499 isoform X2 n=1 Tax=Lotus japonicus TaxID=34305 RepID=UPI002584B1A8|nr:uncharacterized protein LOC130734499 isoform X2 [Lotus japonicus]